MPAGAKKPRPPLYPLAVFLVALLLATAITVLAVDTQPALRAAAVAVAQGERPPDDDHYLANDVGGQVDHHVLWFDIDPVVARRLREADVLFVGHSRLMFALRPDVLRPFFARHGVSYYAMGFGFREHDRFPLQLIRRLDLRPRLVVANADGFFTGGLSPWAEQVNRDTAFAARKLRWEAEAAHRVRGVVQHVLPNWFQMLGLPGLGVRRAFVSYRSRFDGTWQISPWPEGTQGFKDGDYEGAPLSRGEILAARTFKSELDARGARLVLTRVPSPEPMPGAGPARFAELLAVPLVLADVPGPTTYDNSHLSEGSAHDWSAALVGTLEPLVAELAARPRPPTTP